MNTSHQSEYCGANEWEGMVKGGGALEYFKRPPNKRRIFYLKY